MSFVASPARFPGLTVETRHSAPDSQHLAHVVVAVRLSHAHAALPSRVGEPVDYARHAIAVGLTEIGFSDHSPMARDDFDNWRMRNDQLDEYVKKVRLAQKTFPQLTIRLALEVDYLRDRKAGFANWPRVIRGLFHRLGHYVSDSWAIDDPSKLSNGNIAIRSRSGKFILSG